MIEYCYGNIFDSECEALVNPVNCVGVMGAGLAKQFKDRFPWMFTEYVFHCKCSPFEPGDVTYHWKDNIYIFNLATKDHWKDPSQLLWISYGLTNLADLIEELDIKSIAIPALGAGLGGLNWNDVKPMIEEFASNLPDVLIEVYPPKELKS